MNSEYDENLNIEDGDYCYDTIKDDYLNMDIEEFREYYANTQFALDWLKEMEKKTCMK